MGVHQLVSNNRPTRRKKKNYAVAKEKRKVRKAKRGPKKITLEDVHLLSDEQIKHKAAHPNSNITVSGKRRRKMLKRLRHSRREQNKMEVVEVASSSHELKDTEMTEVSEKVGKSSRKRSKTDVTSEDVDMEEESNT